MWTLLVTGSDTDVGKTHVVAALARQLATSGARVQIVKPVETGAPAEGDAARAQRLAVNMGTSSGAQLLSARVEAFTLLSFAAPLAPPASAQVEGKEISFTEILTRLHALPPCDWRVIEGAGGIATPLDHEARDWADFATALAPDAIVIVVPDRLGAINQARLAHARAAALGLNALVWLNEFFATDPVVAASNRSALAQAGVPILTASEMERAVPGALSDTGGTPVPRGMGVPPMSEPSAPGTSRSTDENISARLSDDLAARDRAGLRRALRVSALAAGTLNLAENDYLDLARDPTLVATVAEAARLHGTSAAASPLITGWQPPHAALVAELGAWHGFSCGLLWNSGYAANSAVLGALPRRGDLVLADRLVHHSMIAGLLRSGARLQRYEHLDLAHLEELLEKNRGMGVSPMSDTVAVGPALVARPSSIPDAARRQAAPLQPARSSRAVFVATESVFSMDGDQTDLVRLADLKRRYGFFLIVDEAHALGWFGPEGAGLVRAAGVADAVDVLVGTFGKTLASGGAYTLFHDETVRDWLVNFAGEFIYSTALSPLNIAAASAAIARVRELASDQPRWHAASHAFRTLLRAEGWDAPDGDSPIVPVKLGRADDAMSLAAALRERSILVGAVRPPTVPAGTSRLRISLKRTFTEADAERLLAAMHAWRAAQ